MSDPFGTVYSASALAQNPFAAGLQDASNAAITSGVSAGTAAASPTVGTLSTAANAVSNAATFLSDVTNPANYLRGGLVVIGILMVVIGLWAMTTKSSTVNIVSSVAKAARA